MKKEQRNDKTKRKQFKHGNIAKIKKRMKKTTSYKWCNELHIINVYGNIENGGKEELTTKNHRKPLSLPHTAHTHRKMT